MTITIYKEKCSGCGICADSCPNDVIRMDENTDKAAVKYPEDCIGCFGCELNCPSEAINVYPVKEKYRSVVERSSGGKANG
jgi:adenylylsulfate reductase subunit B